MERNLVLLVTVWVVTGLATVSLCARLYTRYWRFSRFYWDDLFVFLAWAFSVPMAVQVTISSRQNSDVPHILRNVFLTRPITQLFFYNSVWAIKLSFLVFFRRIGVSALPEVKKYWTAVFVVTLASYALVWLMVPLHCWATKSSNICFKNTSGGKGTAITLSLTTVIDIITDCLIVAVPFMILSHLRLSRRQITILYTLFSTELITMMVAIIRVVIATTGVLRNRNFQIVLLIFLSHMEANTAIIVACGGTLRSLFTLKNEPSSDRTARGPSGGINPLRPGGARIPNRRSIPEDEVILTSPQQTEQFSRSSETSLPIELEDISKTL